MVNTMTPEEEFLPETLSRGGGDNGLGGLPPSIRTSTDTGPVDDGLPPPPTDRIVILPT